MNRSIQIRKVPAALHEVLKARAKAAGLSLSAYLLGELREIADRPTLAEFRTRLHERPRLAADLDTAALVRKERSTRFP